MPVCRYRGCWSVAGIRISSPGSVKSARFRRQRIGHTGAGTRAVCLRTAVARRRARRRAAIACVTCPASALAGHGIGDDPHVQGKNIIGLRCLHRFLLTGCSRFHEGGLLYSYRL
jgi:hypothetical protein